MKSTFIMCGRNKDYLQAILVIYHTSAKIAGKVRWSVHESGTSFNPDRGFYSS